MKNLPILYSSTVRGRGILYSFISILPQAFIPNFSKLSRTFPNALQLVLLSFFFQTFSKLSRTFPKALTLFFQTFPKLSRAFPKVTWALPNLTNLYHNILFSVAIRTFRQCPDSLSVSVKKSLWQPDYLSLSLTRPLAISKRAADYRLVNFSVTSHRFILSSGFLSFIIWSRQSQYFTIFNSLVETHTHTHTHTHTQTHTHHFGVVLTTHTHVHKTVIDHYRWPSVQELQQYTLHSTHR